MPLRKSGSVHRARCRSRLGRAHAPDQPQHNQINDHKRQHPRQQLLLALHDAAKRQHGADDGREFIGPRNWYKLTDKLPGSAA